MLPGSSEVLDTDPPADVSSVVRGRVDGLERFFCGLAYFVGAFKESLSGVFPQLSQLGARFGALAEDEAGQLSDLNCTAAAYPLVEVLPWEAVPAATRPGARILVQRPYSRLEENGQPDVVGTPWCSLSGN